MSYRVENTQDELDILNGAKIINVEIKPVAEDDPELAAFVEDEDKIVLTLDLPKAMRFIDANGRETSSKTVTFEVWQDAEGNGPGYLSFTGGRT